MKVQILKQSCLVACLLFTCFPIQTQAQTIDGTQIFLPIISERNLVENVPTPPSPDDIPPEESICGTSDNRTGIVDSRVGRIGWTELGIESADCTVFLVSNGSLLTAGHCTPFLLYQDAFVEFNIPQSNNDRSIVRSASVDQYRVNKDSIRFVDDDDNDTDDGEDWAIFEVEPNASTNLTPFVAQGNFFRLTQRVPTDGDIIQIVGQGVDDGALNQTTQTHSGPYIAQSSTNVHIYAVDTRVANSGSPIIWQQNGYVAGIHTNAGCNSSRGGNTGTSFTRADLSNALNSLHGSGTVHVDQVQFTGDVADGSVFRPFSTLSEAIDNVASGGTISMVTGEFSESFTRDKPIRLIAPVGPVLLNGNIKLGGTSLK